MIVTVDAPTAKTMSEVMGCEVKLKNIGHTEPFCCHPKYSEKLTEMFKWGRRLTVRFVF